MLHLQASATLTPRHVKHSYLQEQLFGFYIHQKPFFFKSHHGKKVVISSITFVSFSHLPLEVCEVIFVLL